MLTLDQYPGQFFWIGDNIKVYFIGHRNGGKIRIGIDAPRDVTILRDEVKRRDEEENRDGEV